MKTKTPTTVLTDFTPEEWQAFRRELLLYPIKHKETPEAVAIRFAKAAGITRATVSTSAVVWIANQIRQGLPDTKDWTDAETRAYSED